MPSSTAEEGSMEPSKKRQKIWEESCPFINKDILDAFGEEVHFFMHVHVRGYDRDGRGNNMDASFYDKYGAPVIQQDAWMDGYHAIELELSKHFNECIDTNTEFPLIAGMAGGAHLYKPVGHDSKPWNWTGFVPQRKVWCTIDKFHKNRHFLNLRGNEIQNNLWDYHPYQERKGAKEHDDKYEQITPLDSFEGKGYWLKGQPWARYIHIISLKSHDKEGDDSHLRYNYIVHPLAYRKSMNDCPDNSVDGVQWSNLNIKYDRQRFKDPNQWGTDVHGLEIYNDFTYFYSWCPRDKDNVVNGINCYNGTVMHKKENDEDRKKGRDPTRKEYIYWHDTYPLEFGEFLLDTSLERGVYIHVLAANDAFYTKNLIPDASDAKSKAMHEERRSFLLSDPKGGLIKEHLLPPQQPPEIYCTKTKRRLQEAKKTNRKLQKTVEFFESRPYCSETAFGHTTLIDTEKSLHKIMKTERTLYNKEDVSHVHTEEAEHLAMQMLIDGKFYAHTGVYDLFNYGEDKNRQVIPFVIPNQPDQTKMCYQMTIDTDLIFDFPKVKGNNNKGKLIWRYSLEYEKDDGTFETVHGYFKMDTQYPTRVNLSENYEKNKLKWIQFAAFKEDNPQRRAWFNAVRGLNFGDPKPKDTPPKRSHRVVLIKYRQIQEGSTEMAEVYEDEDFKPIQVNSNELEFLFAEKCTDEQEEDIYVYDMQVCALQPEDNPKTAASARDPDTKKFHLPERFIQNVHGYFRLNNDFPTKLKLSYSWDPATVLNETVNFYCIDTHSGQPTRKFPHPVSTMPDDFKV